MLLAEHLQAKLLYPQVQDGRRLEVEPRSCTLQAPEDRLRKADFLPTVELFLPGAFPSEFHGLC